MNKEEFTALASIGIVMVLLNKDYWKELPKLERQKMIAQYATELAEILWNTAGKDKK